MPFENIGDWATTRRAACMSIGAQFTWPSDKMSFNRHFTQALHLLPPAHLAVVANTFAMPESYKRSRAHNGPSYPLQQEDFMEVFHGTSPFYRYCRKDSEGLWKPDGVK